MEINIRTADDVLVVDLAGEIDGKTGPVVQEQLLPLFKTGSKILIDMGSVSYMSSAGLRVLLSLYRQATSMEGQIALASLGEEIEDTMSLTGFMRFFTIYDTVKDGLAAFQQSG